MKILCLSRAPLDYKAGIPSYCKEIYSCNLFRVDNFSYDISGLITEILNREYQGINETVFPSEFILGTLGFSFKYVKSILQNIENYKFIHLQHPDPLSALVTILAKLKCKKTKLIITWHADIYRKYILFTPFLLIIDLILFLISYKIVFFTTSHLKNFLFAKFKIIKKKCVIIPFVLKNLILDDEDLNTINNRSLKDKKTIKLISVGRLVSYKGYEYAIKAMKKLEDNVVYYIVGDGPLKNNLNDLIDNLGLQKRIKILGQLDENEKVKFLKNSDIFLFPSVSRSEAYGIVQLEAMFFRLPIINTFLDNGVNFLAPQNVAYTCKPKNSEEIVFAVNQLITNNFLYQEKSGASLSNLERFNFTKMMKLYQNLFS